MKTTLFKLILIVNIVLILTLLGCKENKKSQKPNIVFIIVDDMGYNVPGCYGGNEFSTPNIDNLATNGMRFTSAYSGSSLCAPSRSSLLTGQHTGHVSLRGNTGGIALQSNDTTFAEVLKKAGYKVGGFGKWGLGDVGTAGIPELHGFDEFFGYYHQIHAHFYYTDYLWKNSEKISVLNENNNPNSYTHNIITERMKNFIKENAKSENPFFCFGTWTLPHTDDDDNPQIPTSDSAYKFYEQSKLNERNKKFAAMHKKVDLSLGEIIDLLKELNIEDNTLVIFTSDNGGGGEWLESFNLNGPYRGYKRTLYEGGIKVPFIVKWPNKVKANTISELQFYFPDIMPTIASIAEADEYLPKNIDGISILPTLLGENDQQKHKLLYWEIPNYNWSEHFYPETWLQQAIRKDNWKLVRHFTDEPWELYNIKEDPYEKNNISSNYPELVNELVKLINENHTEMIEQIEPEMPKGKWFR
ncbi:MAG: arylsulfatase [Ignavibacteriae bacterium]|nr:arylsulfatase [Ignavibacteriota bacterium]MCB9211437.1 arylsulfatase [Ignavibacteriales bacterium]MCB9258486.1 arylsulfatase [Ignavibacteriales bacterium]